MEQQKVSGLTFAHQLQAKIQVKKTKATRVKTINPQ